MSESDCTINGCGSHVKRVMTRRFFVLRRPSRTLFCLHERATICKFMPLYARFVHHHEVTSMTDMPQERHVLDSSSHSPCFIFVCFEHSPCATPISNTTSWHKKKNMEGKVTVNWRTDLGTMMRGVLRVGPVSRTLISVDRLQETGHDVILTKNTPRIVNLSSCR